VAGRREIEQRLEELSQRLDGIEQSLADRAPASEIERLNLAFDLLAEKAPVSEIERLNLAFDELGRRATWDALHERLQQVAERLQQVAPASEIERLNQVFDLLAEKAPMSEVGRLDLVFDQLADLAARVQTMEREHERAQALLASQVGRLDRFLRVVGDEPMGSTDAPQAFSEVLASRFDALYAELELEFRGSRAAIRERLKAHLPVAQQVARDGRGPVVDVGCGRGEWLELLRDHGIPAVGVDVNETFVERCREAGLDVRHEDALTYLWSLEPDHRAGAVTAFHLAEHLGLDLLVDLIDAALSGLRPGGALLLETPNPENLTVGSANFYLDPTHVAPLPPALLAFLVRSRGFVDVEIRPLNPPDDADEVRQALAGVQDASGRQVLARVVDALFGPMDYAVVGWKPVESAAG
jgi:SAM-dependent methyltransferase